MEKILICGAGGIGSFLAKEINRLILNEQINLDEVSITIADNDIVELKNIKYQNFSTNDLNKNKAKILADKYCLNQITKRIIDPSQLKGYTLIISCVDNAQTRKMIFEYCFKNKIYFIDLRAEGRAIAIFTKENANKENLLKSLFESQEKSSSCQLEYELNKNIIQQGNLIVATIGSQILLNYLRKEINQTEMRFYF